MPGAWTDLDRPPLDGRALRRALVGPGGWSALEVLASTGSTNADLLARPDAPAGTVLVADHQSGGRGRLGRTWQAPPRSSLAVSVLLRPAADGVARERWSWLPLLTGLAVADALGALDVRPRLKWPNDVLLDAAGGPAKVCGVLAEVRGDVVVLGAGVNVAQRRDELPPPPDVGDAGDAPVPPTSLALAGAGSTDRDTVLRRYLRALRTRLDAFAAAGGDPAACGLLADYRAACATLGADVRVHLPDGTVLTGRAEDVDADGRLVVLDASAGGGGARTAVAAGDVVHVRPAAG
ncbi:biotin--[acetyl-CoA-carboxylase] ligase [Kineococcus sp. SYSU DK004]|uniref:biotin--[acetyl-CoA-carboxylase] ligase n=1 Tax=Kineococcus sp. SYSU DK004 TaxID=3383125 RepID=UPI003D7CAD4B